jgi:RHS repeat-associated protein
VTSAVTTRGLVSFGVTDPSTSVNVTFNTREASSNKPQLVVTTLPSDTTAPTVPTALAGTVKSGSEVDLSWTASTDNTAVAGYRVYRDGTLIATVGSTSWFDTGLAAGSTHTYAVSAVDAANNQSAQTATISKTTLGGAADTTPPTVPTGVTATASAWNSVAVSWTASTDAVGVTSYNVLRNGTAIGKVSAGSTSFTDATTQPSTAYTYSVTASDAAANTSSPAAAPQVTTPACGTACTTTTTLNPVADSYVNQASSGNNYGTLTTMVIKGTSGSVENAYLRFDTSSVPTGTITGASLNLYSTTASSSGYTVKAESNTTWGETTITYANAPALGSTITSVGSTTANQYSSANVTSAVTTRGLVSFGVTDPSTSVNVTFNTREASSNKPQLVVTTYALPTDSTAPSTPTNLAGTVKSGSEVDLTWSGSTDNTAVAGYRVYRDGTLIATVGSTSWFDTGLVAGSTHTYQVSAIDAANNESTKTATLSKTTTNVAPTDTTPPSTPANVTAASSAWSSATVSWTASTDNIAVTSYTISRNGTAISKVSGSTTTFTDATTAASTSYTYTVTASDAAANVSSAAAAPQVTTPALGPPTDTQKPSVPSALVATAAPGQINLAWTASTDDTAVAGYNVYRDGTKIATTYSSSYADLGLESGTPHTYTVAAFDGAANTSDPSTGASASAAPAPPSSVSYAYDLADRMTGITTASGSTTTFTIDALGRHSSQTIGSNPASIYSYLGTSDGVVAIASGSATTVSAIDAIGDRVATSTSGSFGFLLPDLHGNQAGAFNAAGTAISDAFAYDAWGQLVAAVTSALPTPWRYQGRMLESAPGTPALYDFSARSYDPALGTFTSLDSVAGSVQNPITLNRYLYADANPATLVDPDGHWPDFDPWGAAKAVAGKASDLAGGVGNFVRNPGGTVSDITATANQALTNFLSTASQAVNNFLTTASQAVNNVTAAARGAVSTAVNTAAGAVSTVVTATKQAVHTVTRTVTQTARYVADTATQMVSYASANASMITHLALGAATFIPVVGSAAAVADAGLYLYEGDSADAALSMLAVVPGGELVGDAGKLARGGEKALTAAEDVVKVGEDVDRLATAGGEFERAASEGFGGLSEAGEHGIQPYSALKKELKGTDLEAHHLIEQRFKDVIGQKAGKMSSIAVTDAEHQGFTNEWRRLIPYGAGTAAATPESINSAAREIYSNYPSILSGLGL